MKRSLENVNLLDSRHALFSKSHLLKLSKLNMLQASISYKMDSKHGRMLDCFFIWRNGT